MAENSDGFLLAVIGLQDSGPLRPGIGRCSGLTRLGHHLQLSHGFCTQTDTGSHTVISGVTSTDDKNVLSFRKASHLFGDLLLVTGIQKAFGDF